MTPTTRVFRRYFTPIVDTARRRLCPQGYALYTTLIEGGFEPNLLIDVLPDHRIIYVSVPKCASSCIKKALSALLGRDMQSSEDANERKLSGLKSPKHVGLSTFWRVTTDPCTLRFSFVRNPYARLVSLWAHQFRDRPLVSGQSSINSYLAWRGRIDASLPKGEGHTLSFRDFVRFAAATSNDRVDPHWERQVNIIDMPGIALNLVGKVESFAEDFRHVLDHVRATPALRRQSVLPFNVSDHASWPTYYAGGLADVVYQAYQEDFDRFRYPRTFPS
jgi:hypothetical protein